jgi:hypothetical protein
MLSLLSDLGAAPGLVTGTGGEPAADLSAGAPAILDAFLPSAMAAVRPSTGKGTYAARERRPRAEASWQRQTNAQSAVTSTCRPFAQPDLSKQYPHMTRIAAANGGAKGSHPARDPV